MKNNKLVFWSVTVALAGFLFGFDTVVISGANQAIKALWQPSTAFHGFIMSAALWGTVLGALAGGIPCDKFGRKKTLFWIGILYLISAVGCAVSPDPYTFSLFRFIGGVGVGASSVAAPTYISEISSSKNRGRLVALYQFMIVFGILIAYISNYLLVDVGGDNDWRYMLGIEGLPALIYIVMILGVSESPRWLALKKKDHVAALKVLTIIEPDTATQKLQEIQADTSVNEQKRGLFSRKYNRPIMLAFLLAFFNQLSGINFILYYAPELLDKAGFASEESLFSAISIGGINLVFTIIGMILIDKLGRRQLMFIGSIGYIIGLSGAAWAFYSAAAPIVLLSFILVFIASHAIGQGAVIWVFISEIFPTQVRALGQAFGSGTHWVFAAIITLITPLFIDKNDGIFGDNPWPVFIFFAFMMVLQLIFTWRVMPETKGKSLEELEQLLTE